MSETAKPVLTGALPMRRHSLCVVGATGQDQHLPLPDVGGRNCEPAKPD
jgi:hypothetical protein